MTKPNKPNPKNHGRSKLGAGALNSQAAYNDVMALWTTCNAAYQKKTPFTVPPLNANLQACLANSQNNPYNLDTTQQGLLVDCLNSLKFASNHSQQQDWDNTHSNLNDVHDPDDNSGNLDAFLAA